MPFNPIESLSLLKTLWPETATGWGEFRLLGPAKAHRPLFLPVPLDIKHLTPALEWAANRNQQGANCFFGVHLRNEKRGINDAVKFYNCLIADLDDLDASWPKVQALHKAGCPASIMVKTHRGVHLYWLLKEPEATTGIARQRMQLLQKVLGSDMVHDPARILRLPGFNSYKEGKTLFTSIAWLCPDIRYTSEQIENFIKDVWPDSKVEEPRQLVNNAEITIKANSIPPEIWKYYVKPAVKGTRSQLCLSFIEQALFHGWEVDQIYNCIMQLPIGGHYTDRGGNAHNSFAHDLDKAKENVYRAIIASLRVVIAEASIYENPPEANIPGTRKLKIRLIPYNHKHSNESFIEWLQIPDEWHPEPKRWYAFLRALGFNQATTAETLIGELPGRFVRVEFGQETTNKVRYFYKDC